MVTDFANDNHDKAQPKSLENVPQPGARPLSTEAHRRRLLEEDIEYDVWLDDCMVNLEFGEEDKRHDAS